MVKFLRLFRKISGPKNSFQWAMKLKTAAVASAGTELGTMMFQRMRSRPALAAAAVFSFIGHWNEFFQALIFLNSRENFTIPLGLVALRTYAGDPGEPKDHLLMAGSVIATLPIVVVFFLAQKYFVQGIVTSGLKG